jgi:hypothetical protein
MSMYFHGMVRIEGIGSYPEVRNYWAKLAEIHGLWVGFESKLGLEPDVAAIMGSRDGTWFRFGLSDDQSHDGAEELLGISQIRGAEILARRLDGVTYENVWTRVPQWRCINFMLYHEFIRESYIIVEHASSDAPDASDMKFEPLSRILSEIWRDYCWHTESEDAYIAKVDYSR